MRRILLALALCLFGTHSGFAAAKDAPDKTGAFAAYCPAHFQDCSAKITEVLLDALAVDLGNKTNNTCGIPEGIQRDDGRHAIIDWMAKHPETASLSVSDGVQAAARGLWNCQAKIATGMTSSGVPDTTGRYVSFCADSKNYVKCANETVSAALNVTADKLFDNNNSHCEWPKGVKTADGYAKLIAWLKIHPETYTLDTDDGLNVAIDANYPCKK